MPRVIRRASYQVGVRPTVSLIYGLAGLGKSTLVSTALNPIHYDFDKHGFERIVSYYRPDSDPIEGGWEDFIRYIFSDEYKADIEENGYKTAIIDTVGKMLDDFIVPFLIRNETYRMGNTLSRQGWGEAKAQINKMLKRLQQLGLHVIFVAHVKEGEDDKPDHMLLSGGGKDVIEGAADLMGLMFVNQKGKRQLDFNPSSTHRGKNTGRFPVLTIPDVSKNEKALEGYFAGVIEKLQKSMMATSKLQREIMAKLKTYRQRLAEVADQQDMDEIVADIEAEDRIIRDQLAVEVRVRSIMFTVDAADSIEDFEKLFALLKDIKDKAVVSRLRPEVKKAMEMCGYRYDVESKSIVLDAPEPEPKVEEEPATSAPDAEKLVPETSTSEPAA